MTTNHQTRCLAHGEKPGAFQLCAHTCARAAQVGLDPRPNDNVSLNACTDVGPDLPMFVPLGQFPQDDTQ